MAHLTRPAVISGVSAGSFPEQRLVIEPKSTVTMNSAGAVIKLPGMSPCETKDTSVSK